MDRLTYKLDKPYKSTYLYYEYMRIADYDIKRNNLGRITDAMIYNKLGKFEDFLEELGFESLEELKNALLIKIPEIEDCEEVSITKVDNKDKFSPASKEDIYKAIAKDLDKRILKDISKVFKRYGIELDEDRFMQVVKEYQLKVEN